MSTLADSLLTKDIHLHLRSTNHGDALEELLVPLRNDSRVREWEKLRSAIVMAAPSESSEGRDSAMVLHHARSESASSLVLAVGRSRSGIGSSGHKAKVHLVLVACIPEALNNEYLRILGAISRVCRDPAHFESLLSVTTPLEFMTFLEKGCLQ